MSDDRAVRAPVTAGAIVDLLGDMVQRVVGDRAVTVVAPAPLTGAEPNTVTFCSATGERIGAAVAGTNASIVLCRDADAASGKAESRVLIEVADPRLAFIRVVDAFFSPPPPRGIHATATIDPRAELADDVYVGPGAYIGECVIGAGSVIHGRAYLYSGTRLGRRVIVHAGAVLGADGFGYQRDENLEFAKFPHLGGVVVEDDVEIGANACIDRGTLVDTLIREGAKIDNLVHIAHNVVVGRHAAVIAHAMIGGSTRIGDYAWVAPCACVRDGLTIGDRATIGLGAVVVKDVAPDETVMGAPARDAAEYKALLARLRELSSSR